MLIQEMKMQESLELLARARLGRLACVKEAQPYIVPFYFAYNDNCLYSFSTVGQKIEWMRANPLVCVEVDEEVNLEDWVSVIIFGRYEELPDNAQWKNERDFAYHLLQLTPMWWEPGYVKTIVHGEERPLVPVYYRIHAHQISGHRATPEPVPSTGTTRARHSPCGNPARPNNPD